MDELNRWVGTEKFFEMLGGQARAMSGVIRTAQAKDAQLREVLECDDCQLPEYSLCDEHKDITWL